jgi:threonine dehydrogenase-like Zn-dependent dehydrogenase
MRAVYCDGSSVRFVADRAEPRPGDGEVKLRVRSVGICDTDIQLSRGYMGFRGILGHEFVGTDPQGHRVTAEINNPCLKCPTCQVGRTGHCPNRTVLGILGHDGAMAETVTVPAHNLHRIPDRIGDAEAVFIEPLAAAFRITEQMTLKPGDSMAVVGDGKLGILCAWVARTTGAKVSLVGKHREKMAIAGDGIARIPLEEAKAHSRHFDVVADCTGSPTGLSTALGLVRPCGTVVLKTTIAGEYQINLAPIVIDEVTLIGSRCGPFPKAIDALARGLIDVKPLIQEIRPLEDAEAAFERAGTRGARKIILEVSKG